MTHPAEILPREPIGPGAGVRVGERLFRLPPEHSAEQIARFLTLVANGHEPGAAYDRVWK